MGSPSEVSNQNKCHNNIGYIVWEYFVRNNSKSSYPTVTFVAFIHNSFKVLG